MQPIQDKDFDQLFKDAFDNAEIAPSKDLWSDIESEIEPRKKRIIPLYWLSAAVVLVIATVGFLVYQQQDVAPKQYANNVDKVTKPVNENVATVDSVKKIEVPTHSVVQKSTPLTQPTEAIAKKQVKENSTITERHQVITAPEAQKQEIMIAQVQQPQKDIRTKIEEAVSKTNADVILAANPAEVATDVAQNDAENENKGIRNVGDVVNLIVNKVDKRKEKFIQFRTDDDDSSISSINIGPFKFGKRKK